MRQRVITAAICIPLFLLFMILGGWWLGILLMLIAVLGSAEYLRLVNQIRPKETLAWSLLGIAYVFLGFISLLGLRLIFPNFLLVLWLLLTIWITDTGAYMIGSRYGRTKMAPMISPNKTWEGAIGGGICGAVIAGAYFSIVFHCNFFVALLLTLLISSIGQAGDLLESKIKRLAGVKDSGNLLPGHGGVLDRFDSIMLSAPFAFVLSQLFL